MFLASCQPKDKSTSSVFSTSQAEDSLNAEYDLYEIEESGELIAATLSGPDTYFEFRGRGFGLQHDLAEDFSRYIGVRLRMEVSHDTLELLDRLQRGEVDLIAMKIDPQEGLDSCGPGWLVNKKSELLRQSIAEWYTPEREHQAQTKSQSNSKPMTRRRPRPVMLDAATGQISQYDALLQKYASEIGWDWRLLAAQCYQESAFDPEAVSWAGAQGLMQIMPSTAKILGVDEGNIFDPNTNIKASVQYIRNLNSTFSDIPSGTSRIPYILAAYNGGVNHVRDAMALARKNKRNEKLWRDVEPYILLLSQPQYYNDPVCRAGYLRGSETYNYVRDIMDRWAKYRGQARNHSKASTPAPAQHSKHPTKVQRLDSILSNTI